MPIFWDAPYSYIHASTDIGEVVDWIKGKFSVTKEGNKYLAVLHNRNKMVNAFASRYYASAMVSAKCSAKIHVKCVAVWITFPLCVFFFPALPGEYETLSVNYWNFDVKESYLRQKFPGSKQTTKQNTTKQHKHQTTAPPPGKFAKLGETR